MNISLLDVINATNGADKMPVDHHATLIYGAPKTGKTQLMATALRLKALKRVFWFDTENGIATVRKMHKEGLLSDEEISKVIYIKMVDTKDQPGAIVNLLKAICTKSPVNLCIADGVVDSVEGKQKGWPFIKFHYASLTGEDAIFIDSLSQVGTSALALATLGQPTEYKLQLDDYGATGKWLADLLSTIQAAKYCHFFCVSHEVLYEEEGKTSKIVPMCGTKAFSNTVGKYFGNQIYLSLFVKAHKAISTTTSSTTAQAGSRLGLILDGKKTLDLSEVMIEAGFFLPKSDAPIVLKESSPATEIEKPVEEIKKPSALDLLRNRPK